jgi:spore coat protein H
MRAGHQLNSFLQTMLGVARGVFTGPGVRGVLGCSRRAEDSAPYLSLRCIVLLCLLLLASSSQAASYSVKKPKRVPGEEIFNTNVVLNIRIEVSTNEMKAWRREDRKFVRATFYEGSNVWRDVGVHIKGAAGSTRGIDDNPALTIGFGHFTPDQRFYGLRKFHLNNSVQDASYLCENMASELFRKAGVPTPRASYATVELNGRKRGLYVLKEGFTKEMLGLYFKNTDGNLYDGGFLREITEPLERDMGDHGDVSDHSDLKALAKAAQEPDMLTRWEELNRVLDVDRFITFCALEVMAWDWDGYFMNRNNYRVYHDLDTGRMVFFPHGMDQMFWEPTRPILPLDKIGASLVGRAVLTTPQGKQLYRQRFGELFTNVFRIEVLTNRVNELAALLKPHRGADYEGHVKRIRDLIVARHKSLALQLTLPEPTPLKFESGVAKLSQWELPSDVQALEEKGECKREKVTVDGKRMLYIQTSELSAGSWRARVMLDPGEYRFEARVKCDSVVGVANPKKGEGAGVRHSGTSFARENKLIGTSDWELLTHTFQARVAGEEIILLCELRAAAGEAWFDVDSLRLVKLK